MGIFNKEVTEDQLEDRLDRLNLMEESEGKLSSIAEQRAFRKILKQKYGKNWRKFLNTSDNTTLSGFAEIGSGFDLGKQLSRNRDVDDIDAPIRNSNYGLPEKRRNHDNVLPNPGARFRLL